MENLTLEQLQQEVERLRTQLNQVVDGYVPKPFSVRVVHAAEGKIFKRIHDGMLFGNEIHLGYDFSLGFRRMDYPEFYEEVDEEIN